MKKNLNRLSLFSITLILGTLFFNLSFANQRIFDDANILERKHELVIDRMIWEWEQKTNHQMAIITIPSLQGVPIEDYAVSQFEKLGIGSKENNDGLLFIISMEDIKMRIEVGYGLEQYLPDGLVGNIRDNYILPHFKNNDFPSGILQGTYALLTEQAKMEGIKLPQLGQGHLPKAPEKDIQQTQGNMAGLIFFIVIIVFMMKSKNGRSILFWSLIASSAGGGRYRSNGNMGAGNFGSFGGGFGGFGGGFSGGGGASGGW